MRAWVAGRDGGTRVSRRCVGIEAGEVGVRKRVDGTVAFVAQACPNHHVVGGGGNRGARESRRGEP